jgi:hypothetical protein
MLGANVDPAALALDEWTAQLDRLAAAGVESVRLELDWNLVEPEPEAFTWGLFDGLVEAAQARGLEVVLVLGPCAEWAVDPAWQVPEEELSNSIPKSLDVWQRYVRESVGHFRGRVTHWQVRRHPSAPNFRGARAEYRALFLAAAEEAQRADPAARVVLPEAGYLDLATVDGVLQSEIKDGVGVIGVFAPVDLARAPLQWAVLAHEIVGETAEAGRRPVWLLGGGEETRSADEWRLHYLTSWAFGAERCYLPEAAIDPTWYAGLQDLEYRGFVPFGASAWAYVLAPGEGPAVAYAWSAKPAEVTLGQGKVRKHLSLDPRPRLVEAPIWEEFVREGRPTRAQVLAARGAVWPGPTPLVYVDYSLPLAQEFGLYNRSMRDLQGGAVEELERTGRQCLRTKMTYRRGQEHLDNPWIYFDVDDAWLYFDRGKSRLAITVECEGSYLGEKKLGLNLLYDSKTGYRFTPWQWVDPGYEWHSYRFEIEDANMANRDGYDFRVNAKGSKQDLYVFSITVEKLPPAEVVEETGGEAADGGSS